MSEKPARSTKQPTSQKGCAKSGEHPAVQKYRAKIDSIDEGVSSATSKLDRELQDFLRDLRTPVPTEAPEATSSPEAAAAEALRQPPPRR